MRNQRAGSAGGPRLQQHRLAGARQAVHMMVCLSGPSMLL